MLLTSEQAAQYVKESPYSKRTQAGIDLSAQKIQKVIGGGAVYIDKTYIDPFNYEDVHPTSVDGRTCWILNPGVYSVTFNEGINIPADCQAKVTHRSSIYRMGNILESPWWDAGFYCDNMNSTLVVHNTVIIEKNARLAQVVFWRMEQAAKETYDGQWQGLSSAYKEAK